MVKSIVIIIFAIEAVLAVPHLQYNLSRANEYFDKFITDYGRVYRSIEEKARRFEIFKEWLRKCNRLNLENPYATFGINEHSDMSPEELKSRTGHVSSSVTYEICDQIPPPQSVTSSDDSMHNMTSLREYRFDWRDVGAVTLVKDQKMCGSCWAFSATGNIESQYARKHNGNQVLVSEQQLVDCDLAAYACSGGDPSQAFQFLMSVGGIMAAEDYPYDGHEGKCAFDHNKIKIKLKGCEQYHFNKEEDVMLILRQHGPLSIAIADDDVHGYIGGIITKCSTEPIRHAVLLVGFGQDEKGIPYWTMKNSWGHNWGEHGYFRVQRGIGGCGFTTDAIASAVVE